ncbi:acyl-CoA dehydrogenase domain-containing protein [Psychromonas sp. CNPT3]|uniref:acyl-CoA dehydrogenase family protein n=1 Tax=Psychromonas sp. CNPT3 TaxID=314282 RepID=UPI00006E916E|nr:acyl-CoA dehydrogenase family protein [Psychromonas sp. CNPT3]AGH81313.1 acyl-CoA dehydrogenase domain-containing protein [Psychromonas sp. CNPT3]
MHNKQDHDESISMLDTSRMNAEQAAAMRLTEEARDTKAGINSFAGQLFMGSFKKELIFPFPTQSQSEQAIGDKLVAEVSTFLSENLDAEQVDATQKIPDKVIQGLVDLGLFAMKTPKKYNGLGLTQVNYNRVMMAISSYCGSTAVLLSAHQSIGVPQPLKLFGTQAQKDKYLPLFRLGKISAFALTEPEVGSDPAKMETTATLSDDGKHYYINGLKLWCTNGLIADVLVVMAKTEDKILSSGEKIQQISAFIVEREYPGIEILHRCDFMGIRGIENGLLKFNNVKVPVENIILGKGKGLKLALATLNTGRLTLPAAATGMSKYCLGVAREWGRERVQWGRPIGEHEAGAKKIAFIASSTFAMQAITSLTSHMADDDTQDLRIEAAMAKLFCSELSWQVIDETMQLRGGRGYEKASSLKARGEKAYPIERLMRDCRINRIIEGTSDIMKLFLAREAMDPHLKSAADVLKKQQPVGQQIEAGLKLATFYAHWYSKQWLNRSHFSTHPELGKLGKHISYVESTSHKLARTIFYYIGYYQQALEEKQHILGLLMEIGTELFAISATCSYAHLKLQENSYDLGPQYLADVFCLNSQRKIKRLFLELTDNDDKKENKLASRVLNGEIEWLEEGIIWNND